MVIKRNFIAISNGNDFKDTVSIHTESIPTFYRYFPETNETKSVFVMERIGRTLIDIYNEFRPFASITAMQIGLQIVSA